MGRFRERASVNLFCLKHAAFFSLLVDDLWVPGYYCSVSDTVQVDILHWHLCVDMGRSKGKQRHLGLSSNMIGCDWCFSIPQSHLEVEKHKIK